MDDNRLVLLVSSGIFLLLGSLVAGVDAALASVPTARLRALRDELGEERSAGLARYLDDPNRVQARLLAFRVIAIVAGSVFASDVLAEGEHRRLFRVLVVAGLAFSYGILAELWSSLGRARALSLIPGGLAFTRPLELVVAPLAAPMTLLGGLIFARASATKVQSAAPLTEREIEYALEEAESAGTLDHKRGEMLQRVLELKEITARDVMIPRTLVAGLEASTPLDQALAILNENLHSRVPVYRGQIDNVIGVLHVKDLFRVGKSRAEVTGKLQATDADAARASDALALEALARKPVLFVHESQNALTVLRDMQSRRTHLGMVVNEFGAVTGLVTLEDVLEQLVGPILDEHDTEEAPLVEVPGGGFLAAGAMRLSTLAEALGIEFPSDGASASLGGFLAEQTGRVLPVGAAHTFNGWEFTVSEGDARRVSKVKLRREGDAKPASASLAPVGD